MSPDFMLFYLIKDVVSSIIVPITQAERVTKIFTAIFSCSCLQKWMNQSKPSYTEHGHFQLSPDLPPNDHLAFTVLAQASQFSFASEEWLLVAGPPIGLHLAKPVLGLWLPCAHAGPASSRPHVSRVLQVFGWGIAPLALRTDCWHRWHLPSSSAETQHFLHACNCPHIPRLHLCMS